MEELQNLRQILMSTGPPVILAFSRYPLTQLLLASSLQGFQTTVLPTLQEIKECLIAFKAATNPSTGPTFVVLDAPSKDTEDVLSLMDTIPELRATRIVHLFVPTAETLNRIAIPTSVDQPWRRVLRYRKPVRPLSLLQLLVKGYPELSRAQELQVVALSDTVQSETVSVNVIKPTPSSTTRTSLGIGTPKLADNFTAEQLERFKTVQILIAEGEVFCGGLKTQGLTEIPDR
jgi:hypothetical protein